MTSKLPDPAGEWLVRKQVDSQSLKIGVCEIRRVRGYLAGQGGTAQDVSNLSGQKVRRGERTGRQYPLRPAPVWSAVNQPGHDGRSVNRNEGHG